VTVKFVLAAPPQGNLGVDRRGEQQRGENQKNPR
jgi:hypothetical protein